MSIKLIFRNLSAEHRLQRLRLLDSGINPRTGRPLDPAMLRALRSEVSHG